MASEVTPAMLAFLDIEGDPVRVWSGVGVLHYAGESWQGTGSFGAVDAIEEYSEIRAGSVNLTLTEVPNHALSSLGTLKFKGRRAELLLAMFAGDSHDLIGVETLMRGAMDVLKVQRKPKGTTLNLTLTNELAKLRESWGQIYTDADQQTLHPGDSGLRFVQSIQDVDITL
jgi:hypothetical protein